MKRSINRQTITIVALTLLVGVLLGWCMKPGVEENSHAAHNQHADNAGQRDETWTCSMHPQIRQPEAGQCPICGMDLIPLRKDAPDGDPREIKMSATAVQLAAIQTMRVGRRQPVKELRLNGRVQVDERSLYSQVSHIPGRIEQLLVNFTGETLHRGQPLAYIYSPELQTAQEELLQAYRIRREQPVLYQAARDKLQYWKLAPRHIDSIIASGRAQTSFPLAADVDGVVMNKHVKLGDYITKGQAIFDVADLSDIWVLFDVYESDLPWIRVGNRVDFTVQSLPGEKFKGRISFIDPQIDRHTRVASARLTLKNPGGRLKPAMLARGIVQSALKEQGEALVVPKSAVMWTGRRSLVYVKHSDDVGLGFLMREVTLGPSLGDSYVILDGLREGEEIALNGTFAIDAAAQLAGKPSMMNPSDDLSSPRHDHGRPSGSAVAESRSDQDPLRLGTAARAALDRIIGKYLALKDALVAGDLPRSQESTAAMTEAVNQTDKALFEDEGQRLWIPNSESAAKALARIKQAASLEQVRSSFENLSGALIALARGFGSTGDTLYVQYCPMVDGNRGADWLSDKSDIRNPYFGDAMLTCGEVTETLAP